MLNEANFAEKKVKMLILDYFFEFDCLNMLDIADFDSTNGSGLLQPLITCIYGIIMQKQANYV